MKRLVPTLAVVLSLTACGSSKPSQKESLACWNHEVATLAKAYAATLQSGMAGSQQLTQASTQIVYDGAPFYEARKLDPGLTTPYITDGYKRIEKKCGRLQVRTK